MTWLQTFAAGAAMYGIEDEMMKQETRFSGEERALGDDNGWHDGAAVNVSAQCCFS